jgi:DNA (cytosine-5)-methyltransferase 1
MENPDLQESMLTSASEPRLSSSVARALSSIEICSGAGGQARGIELAGFEHLALIDNDPWACETLRRNRPGWHVIGPYAGDPPRRRVGRGDVRSFDATGWRGKVDLLAGGVPCPPFSVAGRQLGADDERDLFPAALNLVDDCEPRAVMLENVRGILHTKFDRVRTGIEKRLTDRGYEVWWDLVQSSGFGVPQLRPRAVLIAVEKQAATRFSWPGETVTPPTVGEALRDLMAARGWEGADAWALGASRIAPTLVGGSKKHGGPDLGPTRAKREWLSLGVDALGLADEAPAPGFDGLPKLTVEMAAVLQGFDPEAWPIFGGKTAAYRQVGNAFPPPVASAFGRRIFDALRPKLSVKPGGLEDERQAAAG